jgi:hypothetical protein
MTPNSWDILYIPPKRQLYIYISIFDLEERKEETSVKQNFAY